jgi:hypothetical protein
MKAYAVDTRASLHQRITMRTTVTLDDDVYQAAKTLADSAGRSLGAVLSELARRGLRPEAPEAGVGIPTFAVPRDAAVIPGNRAADLLAEEGVD